MLLLYEAHIFPLPIMGIFDHFPEVEELEES